MPRRRVTRKNPQQNPRNAGLNRAASMRGNNRNLGQNQPFQGGIGQGVARLSPQDAGRPPIQGGQQCPAGQEPGIDQTTGAQICQPARPNVSGNVPVINGQRATNPTPGKKY